MMSNLHSKAQEHEVFLKELSLERDVELLQLYEQEKLEHEAGLMQAERDAIEVIRDAFEGATKSYSSTDRDCLIEIRPGVGGQEAQMFAQELWEMYERLASARNWQFTAITLGDHVRIGEVRGHTHSSFAPYRCLMCENGVHRVQRIPFNDAKGRIQTSAASVVVLPHAEESDVILPPTDLKIEVKKSTGPGGQSVNASHSAVRLTHLPSGLTVNVTESSSQIDNKKIGLQMLRTRLLEREREKKQKETKEERKSTIGTGDRSEKIRTYNFPRDEVTDHRWTHPSVGANEVLYEDSLEVLLDTFAQDVFEEGFTEDAIEWAAAK